LDFVHLFHQCSSKDEDKPIYRKIKYGRGGTMARPVVPQVYITFAKKIKRNGGNTNKAITECGWQSLRI